MSTCKICGHYYSVFKDLKHVCPPKFMVQGDDDYDLVAIHTYWPDAAAREYVERMDSKCGMEYTDYGKSIVHVIVTAPDGKVTKFSVEPEHVIQYYATEIKDENSNMDSNFQSSGGSESTNQEPEL